MQGEEAGREASLRALALLFLRLGTTAFGGPAAHIALMEDEVVRRRRWLGRAEFLDLLGATNLIPGPNSTELAIHIGHRVAGWPGLVVAGLAFIVPAALITLALAWVYVRFGTVPAAGALLDGVKPVVIAVVVQALWSLGRVAVRTPATAAAAVTAAGASLLGGSEIAALLACGAALVAARRVTAAGRAARLLAVEPFTLGALFLFFAKVGSVLFGSGYVLLAFLQADLVQRWGWLTGAQLLDAVAVGQMTPGPLFTTATFIGYLLGGFPGAAVATAGIFLPAFFFVAVSGPLVPRLRRSPAAGAFLDGVNAAALGLMAAVTWWLARAALVDAATVVLALLAAALLFGRGVSSAWLVLGGALAGLVLGAIG